MTAVNNGFDVFCGKIKGRKDSDMHGIINTNRKLLLQRYIIKRLLTVYRKIFGTRSYGGDALASSCILRHMNSCRIFYDIQSITYKYSMSRLLPFFAASGHNHGGKSKGTTCAVDRDVTAYMAVDRVLRLSTE